MTTMMTASKPKPAPVQPMDAGPYYSRIPDHNGKKEVVVDAMASAKLVNLFKVGGEHRIEIEFTRSEGDGGLALAFPVGSESGVLVLDGFREDGPFSGIDWVKGVPVNEKENPTSQKGKLLEAGKPYHLKVEVRRGHILVELNEYLGTIISGSITLRAARIEADLPEPTPYKLRTLLAQWLTQANAAGLLAVDDARTAADVLIGTLESRHIHAYMQQEQLSSKQHREYIRAMLDVVFPAART